MPMIPVRMVSRHPDNPILTPTDVPPSHRGFAVHGVFNPGAARVGGRTVLVLRVSERPTRAPRGVIRVPALRFRAGRFRLVSTSFRRRDRRYRFGKTVIWTARGPRRAVALTSLSHLRLAWSDDGRHFRVAPRPWLFPATRAEAWGCEDARITQIRDRYWVNYTAVSDRGITTALASTADFRQVRCEGIILPPANRNVTIFPKKIAGRYAAFHRPMPSPIGETAIWYAASPDLLHWGDHRFVAGSRPGLMDSKKIGGGAPPIRTKHGWVHVYHGVDERHVYRLGLLLTDLKEPWNVLARSRAPLLAPEAPYERRGFVPNVCFTCGALERDGALWIYYGAADRALALATVRLNEISRQLTRV